MVFNKDEVAVRVSIVLLIAFAFAFAFAAAFVFATNADVTITSAVTATIDGTFVVVIAAIVGDPVVLAGVILFLSYVLLAIGFSGDTTGVTLLSSR